MKITEIKSLHCDAGWRNFSFLKISTNEGVVGWAEYNECYGSPGLHAVIQHLGELLLGEDPRPLERQLAKLYAVTRQAPGGIAQQAIAAISNALLDIKAKALGIPVYELLGGPVRDKLRLYWSHFGTYRLAHAKVMGKAALRNLKDLEAMGKEVGQQGLTAIKTNIFLFDEQPPSLYMPGFGLGKGWPECNLERNLGDALRDQLLALRAGVGDQVDMMLDLNFNFKTEGYLGLAQALDDLGLFWFEIDTYDANALRDIRRRLRTPIASCESLFGRERFKPFFEKYAMDVAILDAPWKDDLVTTPPTIKDGYLLPPQGPGWGTEINEEAVLAHPPKREMPS